MCGFNKSVDFATRESENAKSKPILHKTISAQLIFTAPLHQRANIAPINPSDIPEPSELQMNLMNFIST